MTPHQRMPRIRCERHDPESPGQLLCKQVPEVKTPIHLPGINDIPRIDRSEAVDATKDGSELLIMLLRPVNKLDLHRTLKGIIQGSGVKGVDKTYQWGGAKVYHQRGHWPA